jgi:hypothetical protein
MLTLGETCLTCISPPRELTIIRLFSRDKGKLCFYIKLAATNE